MHYAMVAAVHGHGIHMQTPSYIIDGSWVLVHFIFIHITGTGGVAGELPCARPEPHEFAGGARTDQPCALEFAGPCVWVTARIPSQHAICQAAGRVVDARRMLNLGL